MTPPTPMNDSTRLRLGRPSGAPTIIRTGGRGGAGPIIVSTASVR